MRNVKHYKSVDFLSRFKMSTPLHKRKDEDYLAMVLLGTNKKVSNNNVYV